MSFPGHTPPLPYDNFAQVSSQPQSQGQQFQPVPSSTGTQPCPSCGHVNPFGAKFCSECGTKLVPVQPNQFQQLPYNNAPAQEIVLPPPAPAHPMPPVGPGVQGFGAASNMNYSGNSNWNVNSNVNNDQQTTQNQQFCAGAHAPHSQRISEVDHQFSSNLQGPQNHQFPGSPQFSPQSNGFSPNPKSSFPRQISPGHQFSPEAKAHASPPRPKVRPPPPPRPFNPDAAKLIPFIRKGDLPKLRRALLDQNFNYEELDENQCSPVHHAVEATRNELGIMENLLENSFSVDQCNVFGARPLHYVCFRKNRWDKIAQLLIDYGASIHAQTADMQTPLHSACRYGISDLVTTLLQAHADPSYIDDNGSNALHIAVQEGGKDHLIQEICRQLIETHCIIVTPERPSSLHAVANRDGMRPLDLAARKGLLSTVHYLLEAGADPECLSGTVHPKMNTLHHAADSGSFDMLNYLISKVPSKFVRDTDYHGNTPLHYAVQRDSRECANLLLRNGASSRVRNRSNQTPLDMVKQLGSQSAHLGNIASPELILLLKEHMEKSSV